MATIQNARDVLLQATSPRINPVPVVGTVDLSNTSQVLNNLPAYTRVTGVTNLAIQNNLAYGGGFLTGFGSLAPLSSVGLASGQVTGNLPSYTRVTGLTDIATQAQLSLTGGYLTGFGTFAALNSINLTDATKVLGNLANARVAGLGALALLASLDLGSSTYVVGSLAANRIAAGALAAGVTYSDFIYADQVMAGEVAIGNSNVRLELGGADTPNVAIYVRRNTGAAVPGASISFRDNAAIGGIGPFMYFDANGRNYALQIDDGGNNSDPAAPALLFIDGQNRHCAGYQQIIEGGRNDGQLYVVSTYTSPAIRAYNTGSTRLAELATNTYGVYATNYGPFTGAHDALLPRSQWVPVGHLVERVRVVRRAGVSDAIHEVRITQGAYSRTAYGVVAGRQALADVQPAALRAGTEDVYERGRVVMRRAVMVPDFDALCEQYCHLTINGVGEGQVLCCNESGDIADGDLLTSSSTPGVAMKFIEANCPHAGLAALTCIVAVATEAVAFDGPEDIRLTTCRYTCG